jgi:hypothetical protein
MDTQPAYGFKDLLAHIVGNVTEAVCERNGDPQQKKFTRVQAAAHMIMGFMPRDVIESMLAGHCVMFHEVLTSSIRDTLRGEMDSFRRATRANLIALDKCFANNLERLKEYQMRPSQGRRDEPSSLPIDSLGDSLRDLPAARPPASSEAPPLAAPEPAAQDRTPPAATPAMPAWTPPSSAETPFQPSRESIAACMANAEAMTALDAGDAAAFARALGVAEPSEAFLAAAATRPDLFPRQALQRGQNGSATQVGQHSGNGVDKTPAIRMMSDGVGSSSPA